MLSGMVENIFTDVNYFHSSKKHEARVAVFQLGAANTSHSCLAIPFVLAGPFEGTVVPQH